MSGLRAGDHVKVGKGRTVWRVDYLSGRRAYLDNGATGAHQPYNVDRLAVVGRCQPRASVRERPDMCETCGNFRDVRLTDTTASGQDEEAVR